MSFSYILSEKSITIVIDGMPYNVMRPAPGQPSNQWDRIIAGLNDPEFTDDEMLNLLSVEKEVERAVETHGSIEVRGGNVYYNGEIVNNALSRRIVDIVNVGLPLEPWIKFAENVYANPFSYSRDELYLFLEKSDLPITEDGHFLAYKNVTDDYKDIRTGTFDNSIGAICEMPRGDVDCNRDRTCSTGLHFASKEYLPHYRWGGSRTVVVKINPADVVSIPSDYDNTKGRTCRYEVVGEIPFEQVKSFNWHTPIVNDDDWNWDDDWWDESEPDVDLDSEPTVVPEAPAAFDEATKDAPTPVKRRSFTRWFRRDA